MFSLSCGLVDVDDDFVFGWSVPPAWVPSDFDDSVIWVWDWLSVWTTWKINPGYESKFQSIPRVGSYLRSNIILGANWGGDCFWSCCGIRSHGAGFLRLLLDASVSCLFRLAAFFLSAWNWIYLHAINYCFLNLINSWKTELSKLSSLLTLLSLSGLCGCSNIIVKASRRSSGCYFISSSFCISCSCLGSRKCWGT